MFSSNVRRALLDLAVLASAAVTGYAAVTAACGHLLWLPLAGVAAAATAGLVRQAAR